jgi:hypothetical protein
MRWQAISERMIDLGLSDNYRPLYVQQCPTNCPAFLPFVDSWGFASIPSPG